MPDLTVNYAHSWENMYKGIDSQGPYYRVSYYVQDWSQSDLVANELRGYTSRTGTITNRVGPHQHPLSTNLVCVDVEIEGLGMPVLNAQGRPSYSGGFLAHATYRGVPWTPYATDDPGNFNAIDPSTQILWCTQEIDFETDFQNLETSKYTWGSGPNNGKATDIPIKVPVQIANFVLTFHQLPYLPYALIGSLRNKLNNATFLGASSEKVWFKGGRSTRDRNTDGTASTRLTLIFSARDVEWNKYLDKSGSWQYIKDGSGNFVFQTADLSPLINL